MNGIKLPLKSQRDTRATDGEIIEEAKRIGANPVPLLELRNLCDNYGTNHPQTGLVVTHMCTTFTCMVPVAKPKTRKQLIEILETLVQACKVLDDVSTREEAKHLRTPQEKTPNVN